MTSKIKNAVSSSLMLVILCVATAFVGCKKQDTYYKYKNTAGKFNGSALDYLQSQPDGVYDSMLLALNRLPNLKAIVDTGDVTVFALTNNSFTLALQNLNEVRKREIPQRFPLYIKDLDLVQLDTLLSRYVVKGQYPTSAVSPYEDGVMVHSVLGDYNMQIQYQHASSSGYENGGPESLVFSDRNNSIFERYWVGAVTNAVDIRTDNAIVQVLSPGHNFGFTQIVSRMDKANINDLWKLVFEEDFDKEGSPDASSWNFAGRATSDWNRYNTDSSYVMNVKGGNLLLSAVKSTDTNDTVPYQTGAIQTKRKVNFLYGKVQVRAKLPEGAGTWPAIWLMPETATYGGWPKSGEIDIMEHLNTDQIVYQTVHSDYTAQGNKTNPISSKTVGFNRGGFNIYGIEWYPDRIDFFVNGSKSFSYPRKPGADWHQWPFDQKFYLILNMAVGGPGTWPGSVDDNALPATMEVDWVKLYEER